MSLPRFMDRVVDSATPALSDIDRAAVRAKLDGSSVTLVAGEHVLDDGLEAGFLIAANLAARLYPRINLRGPRSLVAQARHEIVGVNPRAEVTDDDGSTLATLAYGAPVEENGGVSVSAQGWNVYVDPDTHQRRRTAAPAALVAGVLGVAELFRVVFADELGGRGRTGHQSGAFNLVTLGDPRFSLPLASHVELGELALVGAGAIGQAAAHTLAVAGARGAMLAVDHEAVTMSNLQRYVLTRDSDVGAAKANLLRQRLAGSSLEVVPVQSEWHAELADERRPTLVALDSADARIGVQASLPGPIYNAWTQPADVGWSRHEHFGSEPCLACLYWPDRRRPSQYEQIAEAFHQHPLRVLGYLASPLPVGLPLPPSGVPDIPGLAAPADAARWSETPILDDIAVAAGVDGSALLAWRQRRLIDLFQDGICGGALLELDLGTVPREALVPLAHQSALAGVMLAVQLLVARTPALKRARASATEGRFDVLAGVPQRMERPRARTPRCICSDSVFVDVYRRKFAETRADARRPAKEPISNERTS